MKKQHLQENYTCLLKHSNILFTFGIYFERKKTRMI